MMKSLLLTLYKTNNRHLRQRLLDYIAVREGGQPYSATIREIFRRFHKIDIGMYSYGGCFTLGYLPEGSQVGRYCSFSTEFAVLNGNHPAKFKSLHPFFYNPVFGYVDKLMITRSKLVIENDVWIGHGAIVLPSVTKIENGAIIGAGAVVTENVPPYAIVAGNPGRIIKFRFDNKTIDEIKGSKWWERDIEDIKANEKEFVSFTKDLF